VQSCPDEFNIDNSPLGDMVGEDFTLQLKKTMVIAFFLQAWNRTWLYSLYPLF
jgi:hypothetical protein